MVYKFFIANKWFLVNGLRSLFLVLLLVACEKDVTEYGSTVFYVESYNKHLLYIDGTYKEIIKQADQAPNCFDPDFTEYLLEVGNYKVKSLKLVDSTIVEKVVRIEMGCNVFKMD